MKFAIVSETSDPNVTYSALVHIASSIVKQVAHDFASMWESLPTEIGVYSSLASVPSDRAVMLITDYIPEAPDALAYHSLTANNRPMLKLGWLTIKDAGGTIMKGPNSMSSAMSHEVLETIADPYVCFWSDYDATHEVALEVCDPVEGDAYEIDGVALSNFVGPRWFDKGGVGPYDWMGKLSVPLQMTSGGYLVLRMGGPNGRQKQVYGDDMPEAKRVAKAFYGRRK